MSRVRSTVITVRENVRRQTQVRLPGETLSSVTYRLRLMNSTLGTREFPTWEETHEYEPDTDTYLMTITTTGLPKVFGGELLGIHHRPEGFIPVDGLSLADVPELPETIACRECGTKRAKTHYVLLDDTGTVTFLGEGKCFTKWITHHPADYTLNHALLVQTTHIVELLKQSANHVLEAPHYDTNLVIASAMWATDKYGYQPRSGFQPTAQIMEQYINEPATFSDLTLAAAVLRQCALDDLDAETPIVQSMRETIARNKVTCHTFGLIAYLPSMYSQHERVVQAIAAGRPAPGENYATGYVGTVKERLTLTGVTIEGIRQLATGSTLVTMRTEDNHKLTWFATTYTADIPEIGQTKTITCTIRKHDEYKGTTSTIVNRCIFV